MTNAEYIRSMSNEELALFAKDQIGCGLRFWPCGIICGGKCDSFDEDSCHAKILNWLDSVETVQLNLVPTPKPVLNQRKLEKAIRELRLNYTRALASNHVYNKLGWALFQTWKKYE